MGFFVCRSPSPARAHRARLSALLTLSLLTLAVPAAAPHALAHPAAPASALGVEASGDRAGRWAWPLTPRPVVRRSFEPPSVRWAAGHRGLDLVAEVGDDVTAVAEGVVSHVGTIAGRTTVSVTHADGIRSTYEPVDPLVEEGARVARGERLGALSGQPGHCDPVPCLHLGAVRGRSYLDPLWLLQRPRIVLLPPIG